MKKSIIAAICCISVLALAGACRNSSSTEQESEDRQAVQDSITTQTKTIMNKLDSLQAEPVFDIVTSMGTIRVKLYEKTPKHRENFARLAMSGYYDGVLFHRVINDFMIQGGDPLSKDPSQMRNWGTGGPDYTIPAEFVPEYTHKKGALAAARRGDAANPMKESSGSQFYIVQSEEGCRCLNGEYTVYGETIQGLDVIDKIAAVEVDGWDRPVEAVKILNVKLVEE